MSEKTTKSQPDDEASPEEVAIALAACAEERRKGALPLAFNADAVKMAQDRYGLAFRRNLPKVGGWAKAEPALRRVSFFFGVIARDIATFHNATEITDVHATSARRVIENECQIQAGSAKEGLVCNGLPS